MSLRSISPARAAAAAADPVLARRRPASRYLQLTALSSRLDELIAAETLGTTSQRQFEAQADTAEAIAGELRALYRERSSSPPSRQAGRARY